MFINSGKVTSTWGKEPPVMTTREELKKETAREEWKKKELGMLILNRRLNNTQLLTNTIQLVSVSYYLNYFYQTRNVKSCIFANQFTLTY